MTISRRRLRQIWVQIHLWPGLLLGALFTLLGLTGSILCFYPELDLWINPGQQSSVVAPAPAGLQAAVDALQQAYPQHPKAWRLEMPLAPGRPLGARYYNPPETAGRGFAPLMVTLDPQTLAITSSRFWGEYAMTWIYNLHYTLLLAKPGRIAVGVVGLLFLLSLLAGLYLWWPGRGRWLAALSPRIRRGKVRATYDWHTLGGTYSLLFLLVLGFTGVMLALPEYANPLIEHFSPLYKMRAAPRSAEPEGRPMISADTAVISARRVFPEAELRWLETPGAPNGTFRLTLWQAGEPGRRFPRTNVWVDAYTGEVLAVRDPRQQTGGDTFLVWQHPLHNGEAFGLGGRIAACLAGLLPGLLWVTGIMRWSQKRQAKAKASSKAGSTLRKDQ